MENKKNIAITAPISSFSGYGQYGRSVAKMILNKYSNNGDYQIFLFDTNQNIVDQRYDLNNGKYKQLSKYVKQLKLLQTQFFDVFITLSVPAGFIQKGLYNIGVTALAETDKVHPKLIQQCNKMDQIWVMSQYNVETLKNSTFNYKDKQGNEQKLEINVPINVVPYSVDKIIIKESNSQIQNFINNIPQQFLFLSVGQWLPGSVGSDRKDIGALISTFLSTFPNSKQVGLILKVQLGRANIISQNQIKQRIKEIIKSLNIEIIDINIYIISGNLSESQMLTLYNHNKIKSYISFTHGQSFGIPLMQYSLQTAKPLLVPYHSGLIDYLQPQNIQVLIHTQTQVARQLFNSFYRQYLIPQSKWYTVNYRYANHKMKQIVDKYDDFFKRAKKQSQYIQNNFNTQIISQKIQNILNKTLKDSQENNY